MIKNSKKDLEQLFEAIKTIPCATYYDLSGFPYQGSESQLVLFKDMPVSSIIGKLEELNTAVATYFKTDLLFQSGLEFICEPRAFIGNGFKSNKPLTPRSDLCLRGLFSCNEYFAFLIQGLPIPVKSGLSAKPLYILVTKYNNNGSICAWVNSFEVLSSSASQGTYSQCYIDGSKIEHYADTSRSFCKDAIKAVFERNILDIVYFFNAKTVSCNQDDTEKLLNQAEGLYAFNKLIKKVNNNSGLFDFYLKKELTLALDLDPMKLSSCFELLFAFKQYATEELFGTQRTDVMLTNCISLLNESPALFLSTINKPAPDTNKQMQLAADWFVKAVTALQKLKALQSINDYSYKTSLFNELDIILWQLETFSI